MPRWRLPLAMYIALLVAHAPLLRLPYYWDEAGYYIFAALDFFHHGWLAPRSTLANGHPPLLSFFLAAAWALAGFHPLVTRAAMLLWAALLLWGVYVLARPRLGARGAGAAALLLGLCPLVFAQAALAQLDLPVAALLVWALVWLEREHAGAAAGLLAAACLMKETAVIAPLALLLVAGPRSRRWLLLPVAVLGLWYVWYHHLTGYWFGNPQYFAYNVGQAALSLPRVALALLRRCWQLVGYNGTWLLTLLALASAWRARRRSRAAPVPRAWLALIGAYLLFHAAIGGAVLARYLLPALALYFIWLAEQILRLPRAGWWVAGCAVFLVAGWFWNPPYPFPYEDNLAYVQFIRLHQAAAQYLEQHPPPGPVWTAWPATDELSRPELGYVTHPLPVAALEDFSAASLAQMPASPAALLLYSRSYQPRFDVASAVPFWTEWARRYFHYQDPAPPAAWLQHGPLHARFHRARAGQWITLAVR